MEIKIDMKAVVQIIGFSFLLSIIFTILKAADLIDWSWLWVWSPTWITMAVYFVLLIVFLIFVILNKDLFNTMDKD